MDGSKQLQSPANSLEDEFRQMFELAGVGMAQADPYTYRFLRVNRRFCEMTGYSPEELLRMTALELTHPDDRGRNRDEWEKTLRGESPQFALEKRYVRKDGGVIWVSVVATILRDQSGQPLRTVSTMEDITERKEAERQLLESETRFRTLGENLPLIVSLARPDGRIEYINPWWTQFSGRSPDDFINGDWLEAVRPDDRAAMLGDWQTALATGQPYGYEFRARAADGSYRWIQAQGRPIRDASGGVRHWINVAQDITERKEAEQALRESEEKYRALFDSIDEGVVTLELIFDENEQAVDLRYLEHNPALTRQTGLTGDIIGERVSELFPDLEPYWLEAYERVAKTGVPERREFYSATLGRWFDIFISRVGGDGSRTIVAVYDNITERKRLEQRQEYLLKLSDALRPLSDAVEIQGAVTRTAMNHFAAERCYYCEIEGGDAIIRRDASREGLPSVAGVYPLESFPIFKAVVEAGRPFVVRNAHTTDLLDEALRQLCLRLQIVSFINVPVIKEGKPAGILCITQGTPRDWTAFEIELAQETAERTWAAVERARAEEALRASEARLQRMVNVPHVGVLTFDYGGTLLHANDSFLEMVGYSRGEFSAKSFTWRDFTPPEYVEASERIMENLRKTGRGGSYEKEYFRKDGSRIWLMFVAADLGDGTIVEYAVDISDRKHTQEALRQSQERLELTLEAGNLGIWDSDLVARRTYWSPEQERLFGLPPGGFDGRFSERLYPQDRMRVLRKLADVRISGERYEDEYRVVWPDGSVRWLAARGRVYRDAQGRAVRIMGVNYDITARREAEERERRLAEAQRRFVADASHELRAPLASVLGNLELLQRYPKMPQEDRQLALRDAHSEASRMARLVHDLLALARGDGGLRLRWETVRLEELFSQVLRQTAASSAEHCLEHSLEPLTVQGDSDRLKELVLILLDNALKYTPAGGTVRLELHQQGEVAELRVSDTGVGIAPEDLPHVFERFYRADKARARSPAQGGRDPDGTGLGLSIARQIVEAHGGRIWLESEPGRGTTAFVHLPTLNLSG